MIKRIPKDFQQVYFFNISAKIIQFFISVFLIRVLSDEQDYAMYTKLFTLASTLSGVIGESLSLAYVRFNTERFSKDSHCYQDQLFIITNTINGGIFLLVFAFVGLILSIYDYDSGYLLPAVIIGYFFSTLSLEASFFRSREKYMHSGSLEITRYTLIALILILLSSVATVRYPKVVLAYYIALSTSAIIGIIAIVLYIKKNHEKITLKREYVTALFSSSVWLILYNAVMQCLNQVDVSMLSILGSDYEVACYGVSFKYYSVLIGFLPPIKSVLRVRMSKVSIVNSVDAQKRFATKWFKLSVFPALTIAVLGGIISWLLFPVLNRGNYTEAYIPFTVLCFCAASAYIFAPATSLIMSMKKYKLQFVVAIFSLVINVIGNYLLIPVMGSTGAAITTTASHLFFNSVLMLAVLY